MMRLLVRAAAFVALMFYASTGAMALERFDIVTTVEMKKLLDDRAAGKTDFVLANSLDEIIFLDSAIPGSVNVPWFKINQFAHLLGEDKDKLIITY